MNQKYEVLDKSGKWYKINANGRTGWVHGDYVKLVEEAAKPEPIEKVSFKSLTISGSKNVGDKHNIKAEASSKNGVLYKFVIKDLETNKSTVLRDFNKSNTVSWTPNKAGKYSYQVYMKDSKDKDGQKSIKQSKDITINPIPPAKLEEFTIEGTGYATDTHIIKAKASSQNQVLYQFRIMDLNSGKTTIIRDYDKSNTAEWIPEYAGQYLYEVRIKDSNSTKDADASASKEVTINSYIFYSTSKYIQSLEEMINEQMKRNPQTDKGGGGWRSANREELEEYINPEHFLQFSPDLGDNSNKIATITANPRLNVRKGPGTGYQILGQVNYGETYVILAESKNWYKISVDGIEGWISGAYTKVDVGYSKLRAIEVTTDTLNVREKATTSSPVLKQVKKGDVFIVLDEANGWYQVNVGDTKGWISGSYTRPTNNVPREMYQFLVLSGSSGIGASDLNKELKGKGILEGMGQAFIDAGKKYNINEIYLLSHALLETG
ncbi:MAG TPA: SH3 domain-containing protein, partial [Tissierellaceae bacterium]|nr:SH3 domain-containing protein [Tissierellaceae bacterium]